MKKNTKNQAIKLIEKFDAQLRDLLLSDLKAIRSGKFKQIGQFPQDRLMTA